MVKILFVALFLCNSIFASGSFSLGPAINLPASSTDNAVCRWDGTAGNDIQDSAALLDDVGAFDIPEISTPVNPAASRQKIYVKSTSGGNLFRLNSSGVEEPVGHFMPTSGSTFVNSLPSVSLTGTDNTAIGVNAGDSITTSTQQTLIGFNAGTAITTNSSNTAVGFQANLTGNPQNSVAIGASSKANNNGVSVGFLAGANSTGIQNTIIGEHAGDSGTLSGTGNCIFGQNAASTLGAGSNNLIFGKNSEPSVASASNELVFGSNSAPLNEGYLGRGATAATLGTFSLNATGATGTDISAAGSTLYISGARGTGTGTGGDVIVRTAPAGGTGSAQNALVDRITVKQDGDVEVATEFKTAQVTYSQQVTQNLTADNTAVSPTNKTYIRLSSDSAVAVDRTFTLSAGSAGQVVIIEWVGTNAGEFLSSATQKISATWLPTEFDTLSLIYNGTAWIETARSTNI